MKAFLLPLKSLVALRTIELWRERRYDGPASGEFQYERKNTDGEPTSKRPLLVFKQGAF
jgi:hypothetical protein